jgi:RimJ/RimL family protein N-acetyltransferase
MAAGQVLNHMVTVERAFLEDAPVFAALEQAPDTREYVAAYPEAEHRRKMDDPDLIYLRILDHGEVVGFFILALDPDGRSIEFRRVVIAPERRGIGQAAIRAMEDFCRVELRRPRIWLDVFEDNHRGRHIYQKLGYQHYGQGSYDGRPLLLYHKDL